MPTHFGLDHYVPVLRAWRLARGWTQERAARETGYSLHTWGSYETGRLRISPRLWRIITLLDDADTVASARVDTARAIARGAR